jgi:uncharacterized protein
MERFLYKELLDWINLPKRKPILLKGARQVGKTHLLTDFGKREFEDLFYLNFEKEPRARSLFQSSLDPRELLKNLKLHCGKDIHKNCFIFFDEIQECPEALNSLKYFCESTPEIPIAAAGSLLGVKQGQLGFPVGKVHILNLYPMTFWEFLTARELGPYIDMLLKLKKPEPIAELHHQKLLSQLRTYFYLGGMPEAIATFLENEDYQRARKVQEDILTSYQLDFAKHAPATEAPKISRIWESLPGQLGRENKKFKFTDVDSGARSREYRDALQWLIDAGLVYKCFHIDTPEVPLASHRDNNNFKVYLLDIGLLGALVSSPPEQLTDAELIFSNYRGALTENFGAQTIKQTLGGDLYFWTSTGMAEVDFVTQYRGHAIPLEIKSGVSKKKKSLKIYGERYQVSTLARSTLRNLRLDGNILNYPLYGMELFPKWSFQNGEIHIEKN